jgi:hypothetical protein
MASSQQGQGSQISLEDTFLRLYIGALDRFQETWMSKDMGFDKERFNRQLMFLIALIPDRAKQATLIQDWVKAQKEHITSEILMTKDESIFYAGQAVTTELILFLTQALELSNEDIVAPGTSREYTEPEPTALMSDKNYKRLEVTVPDMPTDIKDVIDLG